MLATGVDLLGRFVLLPELPGIDPAALSSVLLWAGNAFALPTVITGLVDYAGLPSAIQDGSTLKRHMMWMGSAWMLFLVAALAAASEWALAAELAGAVCLVAGGLAAAKVVFEELPARRT
jgi:hypothetical protein